MTQSELDQLQSKALEQFNSGKSSNGARLSGALTRDCMVP